MTDYTKFLVELFGYQIDLQKEFTKEELNKAVKEYEEKLGKTTDELNSLIEALDKLDFKEDGKIDVATLTKAVAQNTADTKDLISRVDDLEDIITSVSDGGSVDESRIEALEKKVDEMQLDIDYIKNAIANKYGDNEAPVDIDPKEDEAPIDEEDESPVIGPGF